MARKLAGRPEPLGAAGPQSWRNWRAKRDGAHAATAVEVSLFSDAWFTSEALDLGPYKLLNALPRTTRNSQFEWKPAIVLRAENLLPVEIGDMTVTDDKHYHGGTIYDEVAALVAILLGVRLVAGPIEREFGYEDDLLGRPRGHSAAVLPTLPGRVDAPQIESLFSQRSLDDLSLLITYPDLLPNAAIALVKSARLYQQALWVSDTSPETAWLLLVSAVETAASFWNAARLTPAEQLDLSYPRLASTLRASPDTTVLETVAGALHLLIGATGKFVTFCTTFVPEPPERRPEFGKFDFAPDSYKAAIKQIYSYRSRALHGGTPFPHPMCMPPMSNHDGTGVTAECLLSLGEASHGATWVTKDVPMHLHLFAHISRGVLLNWWRSLANNSTPRDA